MKKKIIFFDADGTLWYPKRTKYSKNPVWLYRDKRYKNYVHHITLIPGVLTTIKKLRQKGIIIIALSTHPHPPKEANIIFRNKIEHFKLKTLFDEIHATRGHSKSKGEFMLKILKERSIPKSKALMVGDSYGWDYKPAVDNEIDALLIESEYEPLKNLAKKRINKFSDVLKYV